MSIFHDFATERLNNVSSAFPIQGSGFNLSSNLADSNQSFVQPSTIAFVDLAIPDVEQILNGLDADVIYTLQPEQDGISQITEALSEYDNISGVHIISHGAPGRLQLGSSIVDLQTLNQRSQDLQKWASALNSEADILLYGCNVAVGTIGHDFLHAFDQWTSADVRIQVLDSGIREGIG
jgi:hypothetical protein